jgi:uncharacterized Zn finger protein
MAPRRGGVRVASWWGKAWLRAVEESAYGDRDLRTGRALARAGAVGGITVSAGGLLAGVAEDDDVWTVTVDVPVLGADAVAAFGELVAAESGRIARLLGGDLPLELAEQAEEAGVELLPYGGQLGAECSCGAWTQPCRHALAVLMQFGWLVDGDPLTLVLLRGLPREDLLAALHARTVAEPAAQPVDPDEEAAYDAAVRARRVLDLLESGDEADLSHLL